MGKKSFLPGRNAAVLYSRRRREFGQIYFTEHGHGMHVKVMVMISGIGLITIKLIGVVALLVGMMFAMGVRVAVRGIKVIMKNRFYQ